MIVDTTKAVNRVLYDVENKTASIILQNVTISELKRFCKSKFLRNEAETALKVLSPLKI